MWSSWDGHTGLVQMHRKASSQVTPVSDISVAPRNLSPFHHGTQEVLEDKCSSNESLNIFWNTPFYHHKWHFISFHFTPGRGWADSLAELAGVKTLSRHHCKTQHLHGTWHRADETENTLRRRGYTQNSLGLSGSETWTFIISQITSLANVSHLCIPDSLFWRAAVR